MEYELILKAAHFAAEKHRDQRRKGSEASPYINHPISVALILSEIGGVDDPEILSAALLHDCPFQKLNTMRKNSLPVYYVTIHYGNQNFH